MFQKNVEAIIAEGVKDLQRRSDSIKGEAKAALEDVVRCSGEIRALVELAKDVPAKVLERYANVMVATTEIGNTNLNYGASYISISYGRQEQLRGLMGDEQVKPGKYRVLVLLEPIS